MWWRFDRATDAYWIVSVCSLSSRNEVVMKLANGGILPGYFAQCVVSANPV
jgi:hypothetical protein